MNGKVGATCRPPAVSSSLAFTDYLAPVSGKVGRLAARQPQVVLPRRLPMDWPFMAINSPINAMN